MVHAAALSLSLLLLLLSHSASSVLLGWVESPGYPTGYSAHASLNWSRCAPKGHTLSIRLIHLDLEDSQDCENDAVKVGSELYLLLLYLFHILCNFYMFYNKLSQHSFLRFFRVEVLFLFCAAKRSLRSFSPMSIPCSSLLRVVVSLSPSIQTSPTLSVTPASGAFTLCKVRNTNGNWGTKDFGKYFFSWFTTQLLQVKRWHTGKLLGYCYWLLRADVKHSNRFNLFAWRLSLCDLRLRWMWGWARKWMHPLLSQFHWRV